MGERSAIEWTDATWSPIRAKLLSTTDGTPTDRIGWHCEHKSEGCRNCYAEAMNRRLGTGLDFKPGHRKDIELFLDEEMLIKPLRWKRARMIFVCSMTDLFADFVTDAWIDRMFAVMALCPQHIFQVLTKRPERMRQYLCDAPSDNVFDGRLQRVQQAAYAMMAQIDGKWNEQRGMAARQAVLDALKRVSDRQYAGFKNVWLGTSVEDQTAANERIPPLLQTPAAVRWLSCEPLLGAVDLTAISTMRFRGAERLNALTGELRGMFGDYCATRLLSIDWAVAGGESGSGARDNGFEENARSLLNQCRAAGVPFFGKQNVKKRPLPVDLDVKEWPRFVGHDGISNE